MIGLDPLAQLELADLRQRLEDLDERLRGRIRSASLRAAAAVDQALATAQASARAYTNAAAALLVPLTRSIYAGAGLTGGGDLSQDRTISMPAVGTAGTFAYPASLTTDTQGRLVSVTGGSAPAAGGLGIYGDGSDGNVTISGGTTTLSRDMFYDTLTIEASGVLKPGRYRVFAKTAINNSGSINDNSNSASGSTQGGALTATILGGAQAGRAGSTGAGTAGANITNTFGGAGGAGGAGSGGAGGAGGTATVPGASFGHIRTVPQAVVGALIYASGQTQYTAGVGGGSGGGNGGSTGGGGGGGGGNMVLVAKAITNSGTISALGGNGDAGLSSNCGGGGGGGGGVIITVSGSYTGTAPSVAGGTGGASGGGTGVAGSAGSTGTLIQLTN